MDALRRAICARRCFARVIFIVLLLSDHSANAVMFFSSSAPCVQGGADVHGFYTPLTPGISWPAWADLLNEHWRKEEVDNRVPFDASAVNHAVDLIKEPYSMPETYWRDYDEYGPTSATVTESQRQVYSKAALGYRAGEWGNSIIAFDAIVSDTTSPYRAAAAYSAARAALKLGHIHDGVQRISRLVSDPTLQEYHLAAHHLLGTMSYRSGAPAIVAARYAEIKHLLIAPPAIVCRDAELQKLLLEANGGLGWCLGLAFPGDWLRIESGSPTTRSVLNTLASHDEMLDIIRVLAAPTPYTRPWDWHRHFDAVARPAEFVGSRAIEAAQFAASDAELLTTHARERWLATRNPLWGYALAQRTSNLSDVTLIEEMRARLVSLPNITDLEVVRTALQWQYLRHELRLMLMNNQLDDAIGLLNKEVPKYRRSVGPGIYYAPDEQAIIDGGVRVLLENFDLNGARKWAAAAEAAFGNGGSSGPKATNNLKILMAENFDDAAIKDAQYDGNSIRTVVDLLPARKIVSIAMTSKSLSRDQRRAFLATGWLRYYLLGDWNEAKALLPQMREAFPELAADIDDVRGSWLDTTKQRLVTRMLLRTPGLTVRSGWVRRQSGYRTMDMFSIDDSNPSDGNWWCPLDLDQLKISLVEHFYVGPLQLSALSHNVRWDGVGPGNYHLEGDVLAEVLRLADKIIAWHPLLKGTDFNELEKLSKVESGPKLLSEQSLHWADSSNPVTRFLGFDRFLPETLHLAVRSTRYGCRRRGGHGEYSRAAFEQLHKMYPQSEWTTKTPYWFDRSGWWKPDLDSDWWRAKPKG